MTLTIIVAMIGFLGQTAAVIVAAFLAGRSARKAREELRANRVAIDGIADTSSATHKIVNSQRTVMLRLVAQLARRIADENPDDHKAQQAAEAAERDAKRAERDQ